ncbi:hypothetical protein SDC9_185363 [bioreactor metagenome]|uniref:Uncharacterized protein n=1 Tax=bioreactor metagenome TaxID=1076179 RepID=A0A645HHH6_9ZZZZ
MCLFLIPVMLPLIIVLAVLYIVGLIVYLILGTCTWFIFKLIFNKFFIFCAILFAVFFFTHL